MAAVASTTACSTIAVPIARTRRSSGLMPRGSGVGEAESLIRPPPTRPPAVTAPVRWPTAAAPRVNRSSRSAAGGRMHAPRRLPRHRGKHQAIQPRRRLRAQMARHCRGDVGLRRFVEHAEGHLLGHFRADGTAISQESRRNAQIRLFCFIAVHDDPAAMIARNARNLRQRPAHQPARAALGKDDLAAGLLSGGGRRGERRRRWTWGEWGGGQGTGVVEYRVRCFHFPIRIPHSGLRISPVPTRPTASPLLDPHLFGSLCGLFSAFIYTCAIRSCGRSCIAIQSGSRRFGPCRRSS